MPRLRPPTKGTRIAAWIFPGLTLWLGCGYFFAPASRFQSPAFDAARDVMPVHYWGLVFIAVALIKIGAFTFGGAHTFVVAMCAGMGLYAAWAVFFMASVIQPPASVNAPAWPVAVLGFHIAFMATLTEKRTDG